MSENLDTVETVEAVEFKRVDEYTYRAMAERIAASNQLEMIEVGIERDGLGIEDDAEYWHLTSDNDGHWYVILDGEDENFETWVKSQEEGEDCEYDFSECAIGGAPSLVHFRIYYIE